MNEKPTENERHSAVIVRGIQMPAHQVRDAISFLDQVNAV